MRPCKHMTTCRENARGCWAAHVHAPAWAGFLFSLDGIPVQQRRLPGAIRAAHALTRYHNESAWPPHAWYAPGLRKQPAATLHSRCPGPWDSPLRCGVVWVGQLLLMGCSQVALSRPICRDPPPPPPHTHMCGGKRNRIGGRCVDSRCHPGARAAVRTHRTWGCH